MNLNQTIIPKSDQLNSDSLISGPRTIKVTAVEPGSAEQPVVIRYEGDAGQPYKPSKGMRRVLVTAWGSEGNTYTGRRITLYREPTIRFGGEAVGGICISHLSDIPQQISIALTISRGKKKPFYVEPLPAEHGENMPAGWADWSNEERGANRAAAGLDALAAWWKTLNAAEQKALKPTLDGTWKPDAQNKGATA